MAKPIPSFPRLHLERLPQAPAALAGSTSPVEQFCRAFREASGWALRYAPRAAGAGRAIWSRQIARGSVAPGTLALESVGKKSADDKAQPVAAIDLASAKGLADAFGSVLSELERTRHALWQREAELAAGVPVSARAGDEPHLAARLEAVLRGGAEAVGCQAAALYLLDESTSELKLRSCYGLPKSRLMEPARPLRGALADLEALIGHAVALEDVSALPHWKTPEDFPSAVCVPVSSTATPLGTLWMFSARRRDFTAEQTNLLEIVAGRIASDLEREMLLQAGCDSRQLGKEWNAAAEWQRHRLPHKAPLLDGWQLAGWTSQAETPTSMFHDWLTPEDEAPAAFLGGVAGHSLSSSLSSVALHESIKSHARHSIEAGDLARQVEASFLADSPGGELATLFLARLAADSGRLDYAAAGNVTAWLVRAESCQSLSDIGPQLGLDRPSPIHGVTEHLSPDDALVVVGLNPLAGRGCPLPVNLICESLADRQRQSAAVLLDTVRAALASQSRPMEGETAVLVIKRRR